MLFHVYVTAHSLFFYSSITFQLFLCPPLPFLLTSAAPLIPLFFFFLFSSSSFSPPPFPLLSFSSFLPSLCLVPF